MLIEDIKNEKVFNFAIFSIVRLKSCVLIDFFDNKNKKRKMNPLDNLLLLIHISLRLFGKGIDQ